MEDPGQLPRLDATVVLASGPTQPQAVDIVRGTQ
jgi:hypothetical protein